MGPVAVAVIAVAGASAFAAGAAAASQVARARSRARRVRRLHEAAIGPSVSTLGLECTGLQATVIVAVYRACIDANARHVPLRAGAIRRLCASGLPDRLAKAGLDAVLPLDELERTRADLVVAGAAAGALIGAFLSPAMLAAGALAGALAGWASVPWALKAEAQCRCQRAERSLSQAVEVVCLGLRSGLSFDRALSLYCSKFGGGLARSFRAAQQTWELGLSTREEALRAMQRSYDSPIIARTVDSIIRSMRFGSPLADSLEVLAQEARANHLSRIEEEVMKAPVKMMVPVGTMILPSMLILVLGPIMLELVSGF